jgi:hypothetical protein
MEERVFKPVSNDEPTTLGYFITDYIDHMKHHLKQHFPDFT